jgi:hypothetical protein
MIRATGRRFGALFLLTAFLAGGYGLSDLDAFLFHSSIHSGQNGRADVAHLELPGGCGAHAERCVLAVATARPAVAGSAPAKVRLAPNVSQPLSPRPPVHPSVGRVSLQHSRAPPRASA